MLGNYFTLVHVSHFIHQQCSGHTIAEVYSQHKQQLCVGVDTNPVQTIVVSCVPSENYITLREGTFRARKNSVDLFPAAKGKKIIGVSCDAGDRIVSIELENAAIMKCEMFGSRANVLVLEEEKTIPVTSDVVIDAFLKKKEVMASRHVRGDTRRAPAYRAPLENEERFIKSLRASGGDGVFQSLKKTIPALGSTLAKEILVRTDIRASAPMALATDRDIRKVFNETSKIMAELSRPLERGQARIYYDGDAPVCLSLIPLRSYADNRFESYPNIAAAIQRYVSRARSSSALSGEKAQIADWLEKEEKKSAQTRAKIAAELSEQDRRADYERFGKLIMAHLQDLRKGLKSATLEDTVSSGAHRSGIPIPLDPALSPVGNAERYFEKAKKAKGAIEESVERAKGLDARLSSLRMLIGELEDVSSLEELREFQRTYGTQLHLLGYATAEEKENLPPFRIFTVEGGFRVLAGKSSENNDELTTKYTQNRTTCGFTAAVPADRMSC